MTITLTMPTIIMIIAHIIYIIGGVATYKGATEGHSSVAIVGFMFWLGTGLAIYVIMWMAYGSIMYLLS